MSVIRAFVALLLDETTRRELAGLQREIAGSLTGLRWVPPANLHLTIRFLGAVPEAEVPGLRDALAGVAGRSGPFRFVVQGLGAFPGPAGPRVLWAGVRAAGELAELHKRVEEAVTRLGWPADDHPFRPHVTLARAVGRGIGGDVAAAVGRQGGRTWGSVTADGLVLMRSTLAPAGAIYTTLASFPLSAGFPPDSPN